MYRAALIQFSKKWFARISVFFKISFQCCYFRFSDFLSFGCIRFFEFQKIAGLYTSLHNIVLLMRVLLNLLRRSFVNRFIQSLFKCKPISLVGAEQLLLDTHSLKTVLMDLPSVGSAITLRKPPSSYTKVVHQLMTKAEMVLKSVMAPLNPPQTYVADFVKLLPDSDLADFTKVLEMKGVVKKQEQAVYVDLFRSFQAGAQQRAANASQTNANTALETNTNAGQLAPQHSRTDTASAKDSNVGLGSSLKTLPQAAGAKTLSSFPESSANDKEELSSSRISIKNLEKLIKRK